MSTVKATRRARLSAMLGTKLGKPSLKVKKSAEKMLDAELNYINYLRGRKKLFFMTQVQQTRVQVGKKGFNRDDDWRRKRSKGWGFRPRKVKLGKGWGKKSRFGRFLRNVRATGLNVGRRIKYSLPGKLIRGGVKNVRNAGRFVGSLPKRAVKGIWNQGSKAFKNVKAYGQRKGWIPKGNVTKGSNPISRNLSKIFKPKTVTSAAQRGGGGNIIAKGLSKVRGVKPGSIPIVGSLLSLWDFKSRLGDGQSVKQATAGVAGGWVGALATTALAGLLIPEPTTSIVGGITLAILGSLGYNVGSYLTDNATGVNDEQLAEGAQVSSPTKALIGEGGESEFVIPQSKLGSAYQNLLKHVIGIITGAARGFLEKLPVSALAAQGLLGEITKIESQIGISPTPISEFKGGRISKTLKGFGKKGSDIIYNTINKIQDVVGSVISQVVPSPKLDPATVGTGGPSKKPNKAMDWLREQQEEKYEINAPTSVSGYPITSLYGETAGRVRPHGGVDVGTPVGTPVSFAVPGHILAAGKYGDYGNLMDVWLPSARIQMRIAHLVSFVKKSGKFRAGETLAKTGGQAGDAGAGSSTGPHLHFEVDTRRDSTRYGGSGNPLPYSGFIQLSNVQPGNDGGTGGPSLGASYGHPLSSTVKWPSSGGSMGGPSLAPNQKSGSSMSKQISFIPIPIKVTETVPVHVQVPVPVNRKTARSFGVDPLSGRYGEL